MVRSNALWMWVALAVAACAGLASPAAAIVQGRDEPALARHAVMVLGDRGSFCTGVVLSPTVVITAGHCVAGASAWRIYFKDAAGTGVMLEPRTVTVHPGYDANAVKSRRPSIDLAMLRLAEPLPSALQPASLAEANGAGAGQKLSLAGQTLSVAGYGVSIERDPRPAAASAPPISVSSSLTDQSHPRLAVRPRPEDVRRQGGIRRLQRR